jgi:hypothetical protein
MAQYPGSPITFTTKVNGTDIVDASHPNLIQAEVIAIGSIIGTDPHIGNLSSSFVATSTTWATVKERLENLEAGIIADTHTQYVKLTGGQTITASTSSTKGLVVKGASSQSANLQEWQTSSGTAVAYINAAGGLVDTKLTSDINNLYVLNYVFG